MSGYMCLGGCGKQVPQGSRYKLMCDPCCAKLEAETFPDHRRTCDRCGVGETEDNRVYSFEATDVTPTDRGDEVRTVERLLCEECAKQENNQ